MPFLRLFDSMVDFFVCSFVVGFVSSISLSFVRSCTSSFILTVNNVLLSCKPSFRWLIRLLRALVEQDVALSHMYVIDDSVHVIHIEKNM